MIAARQTIKEEDILKRTHDLEKTIICFVNFVIHSKQEYSYAFCALHRKERPMKCQTMKADILIVGPII